MEKCDICSARVTELRRGRCWGCYTRWVEARPVGLGASCCMCGERRRGLLKSVELLGAWMPMCHGCGARAAKLEPLPQTVGEIRSALRRDRRADDRRHGKGDSRVFRYERRQDERRVRREGDITNVEEEMILEIDDLAKDLAMLAASAGSAAAKESEGPELTRIRDRPADLGAD